MKHISTILRWVARLLGVGAVLVFVILATGEGLPDPMVLGVDEKVLFSALALMLIGALAAWWWEVVGGLMIFCGYGWLWYIEGSTPEPVFSLFPLAACIFLIAWLLEHKPAETAQNPDQKKAKYEGKGAGKDKSKRKPDATKKN